MGFLRMTTRFNMKEVQGYMSKIPPSGDYPFHVLLYWPRVAKFLRETRWSRTISNGGHFQVEGRTFHFVGKMIGLLKTSLLRDVPLGVYIPVIVPEQLFNIYEGGAGSGTVSSQFAGLKARTTPKKEVKNLDVGISGNAEAGSPSDSLSPSAARSGSGRKFGSSAQKLQKARMDALLEVGAATSSGGQAAGDGVRDPASGDAVDPDAALQSSIADDHSGQKGSPDQFYDAPPSSQPGNTTDVEQGRSGGVDGVAGPDEAEHSDEEPKMRSRKRNRAGKEGVSEKAAGKRRAGTRR
jgi:hypothetical protein